MKISQKVVNSGPNKVIEKEFIRNLQIIRTKTAYNKGKLYYKEWNVQEYSKPEIKYFRSYLNNKVIPNSQAKLDYEA